ncbi:MAG: S41 family peptidase [Chloroflexi bacterium]|nr:S41 family peptidase [Chloroflexota bacterium]
MNTEQNGSASPRTSCAQVMVTLAVIAMLVGIGFAAGMATMWLTSASANEAPTVSAATAETGGDGVEDTDPFSILDEIRTILADEFVEPDQLDPREMSYGAAAGMVAAVGDAHTMFVEPVQAAIIEEDMQGSFEGIGATVDLIDGVVTIVQPLPNSPAERAGIQAGDEVLAVDGESIEGMELMDAITLIRGPEGTKVTLLIRRESLEEPFSVSVTRARIEVAIVESRMLDGGIGYISLTEFNAVALDQVRAALREILREDPTGLILDLRNNPGGYLHMAIDITSEFLPRNSLVVTERPRDQEEASHHVVRNGLATEIPLVILVNGGSASASEIVAGAIQYHGRGMLVGTNTYGKGSVQSTHTLTDGSSLRVTIAKWVLPGGRILDGDGLTPDIVVEITPEDAAAGRDPQLDRAVDYLQEQGR